MKKLKIAFLSGGGLTHIGHYINFFKNQGHDVSWIAYDRITKNYGIPTYDISYGAVGSIPITKWKYALSALAIRKVIKKISPDILHGHFASSAGILCFISGFRPFVLTVHGSDLHSKIKSSIWQKIFRRVFNKSACVNIVSQELAQIVKTLDVPDNKILIATIGVDTSYATFKPIETLHAPINLLCTRGLEVFYGIPTIIDACEILKRRGIPFHLTFASGGLLLNQMHDMISSKGLSNEIQVLGGYSYDELPGLMHSNDLYISASLWDGTSISLLEAMSCGIFPIVSRIPSNQSWVEDGKTGLMFDCGNAQGLADTIIGAVSDNSLRLTAIHTNRRVVEKKGDRVKNLLQLEKMYYRVIRNNDF